MLMHLVAIGGSDAGIFAALRARELDPTAEVTVGIADAYPNFSICGIPEYISGEVTHWRTLAHRTHANLKTTGMQLCLDTVATSVDVTGRRLAVREQHGVQSWLNYDELSHPDLHSQPLEHYQNRWSEKRRAGHPDTTAPTESISGIARPTPNAIRAGRTTR